MHHAQQEVVVIIFTSIKKQIVGVSHVTIEFVARD